LKRFSGTKITKNIPKTARPAARPTIAKSRALIVSSNYPNTEFELFGCWGDADLFQDYVKQIDPSANIVRMKDAPQSDAFWTQVPGRTYQTHFPETTNIIKRLDEFVAGKERVLFLYFSGHGGLRDDANKDELEQIDASSNYAPLKPQSTNAFNLENPEKKDGHYWSNKFGQIDATCYVLDDDIYSRLCKLKKNQTCYVFTDICHSGTIIDLPYINVGNYDTLDASGNERDWTDVSNYIITASDISRYLTTDASNLEFEIKYEVQPKKDRKPPAAKIIHWSGTRSEKLSYESEKADLSGNVASRGHSTWAHSRIWRFGAQKLTLRQYYTTLIGLMSDKEQIPVMSTSAKNVLDISGYLVTLNDPSKVSAKNVGLNINDTNKLILLNKKK
jgi:hypothetical protein